MKAWLAVAALLLGSSLLVASEDPTESIAGVVDLSECHSRSPVDPAEASQLPGGMQSAALCHLCALQHSAVTSPDDAICGRTLRETPSLIDQPAGCPTDSPSLPPTLAAPANFDSIVNGGKYALVEFYAPWWVPLNAHGKWPATCPVPSLGRCWAARAPPATLRSSPHAPHTRPQPSATAAARAGCTGCPVCHGHTPVPSALAPDLPLPPGPPPSLLRLPLQVRPL